MCFGLFIATGSFSLADRANLLVIPAFLPLLLPVFGYSGFVSGNAYKSMPSVTAVGP